MGNSTSCPLLIISSSLPFDHDILEIKSQRDDLLQYREELERQMELCKIRSAEYLKINDKKNAKYAYCNKKINEKLLVKVDSCILQILNVLSDIQHNRANKDVITTITNGIDTINKINHSIFRQWEMKDDCTIAKTLINELPDLFNDLSIIIETEDFNIEEIASPSSCSYRTRDTPYSATQAL